MNVKERKIALAALHLPNKRAVEFRIKSKLLLRNALELSQTPHVFPELFQPFFISLHVGSVAE